VPAPRHKASAQTSEGHPAALPVRPGLRPDRARPLQGLWQPPYGGPSTTLHVLHDTQRPDLLDPAPDTAKRLVGLEPIDESVCRLSHCEAVSLPAADSAGLEPTLGSIPQCDGKFHAYCDASTGHFAGS
jgi:hypothetical protein